MHSFPRLVERIQCAQIGTYKLRIKQIVKEKILEIKKADLNDLELVFNITETTIKAIYPHYYPKGAVNFFFHIIVLKIYEMI